MLSGLLQRFLCPVLSNKAYQSCGGLISELCTSGTPRFCHTVALCLILGWESSLLSIPWVSSGILGGIS